MIYWIKVYYMYGEYELLNIYIDKFISINLENKYLDLSKELADWEDKNELIEYIKRRVK